MSVPIVLLQIGANPFNTVFEDPDGDIAFTVQEVERTPTAPNTLVRLRREQSWTTQHRDISGPSATYFYFGPESAPGSGYIIYGNTQPQSMTSVARKKRGSGSMRYFKTQAGKEMRWKLSESSGRMECVDGNRVVAVYEARRPDIPRPRTSRSRSNTQSSIHSPTTPTSPLSPTYAYGFGANAGFGGTVVNAAPPYDINGAMAPYPFTNGHAHGAAEHAVLTLQQAALPFVTELLTTLMLIRMESAMRW